MSSIVSKSQYEEIISGWVGDIYQSYGSIKERFAFNLKFLNYFKDKDVLEIGCNAGLFSYSIAQHARSLHLLEKQTKYYKQALHTIKFIKNNLGFENIDITNCGLSMFDLSSFSYNALFASYLLYHLSDGEVEILKSFILPKCSVVVIPTRSKERRSQTNNYYLNREAEVIKLLKETGFGDIQSEWHKSKGYFTVIGMREERRVVK